MGERGAERWMRASAAVGEVVGEAVGEAVVARRIGVAARGAVAERWIGVVVGEAAVPWLGL